MLAAVAFIFFALAFLIGGSGAHTSEWFTATQSMYAGLACLALYVSGIVYSRRQ